MTTFYIDVSHHDRSRRGGPLDWVAIRRHTAPVMCARATYGDPDGWHRDSHYHGEFQNGAKAAGFDLRGSYHNLVRGDQASINRQVDWLRREMDAYDVTWAMVDVERYPELVSSGMWPRWDDVAQFCDRWHTVDSRVLVAYIPGWLYSGYYAGKDIKGLGVPLVESDYGSNPGGLPAEAYAARGGDEGPGWRPTGGLTPAIWQYSSEGDLPGASGKTDYNAFRGTVEQLRALLTGGDDVTPEELASADIFTNPYGDQKTNPRITLDTAIRNIGGDTRATVGEVRAAREAAERAATAAERAATAAEQAAGQPIDYDKLALALLRNMAPQE